MRANINYDNDYRFEFLGQSLLLLPEHALLWTNKNILLISDIHLGKATHFRKSGIPIPSGIHDQDLIQLDKLLEKYAVEKLIFLGDLFHSMYNREWEIFDKWLATHSETEFHLILGNHDILPLSIYTSSSIKVHKNTYVENPFIFSHIPMKKEELDPDLYNIAGHIHPSIRLMGKGKQNIALPCFYFGSYQAVLPAFGVFTGKYPIIPSQTSRIFAVANNKIISI
ncbi:MAG TPA: ligase-associated DNA damage response endonuclease PdeM [Cytophagales bacterium]|nr:ligase-associated DNA damage response endonuclease PdeM [Cytophagales bacterium]